jgi:hypothetical protein
MHSSGRVDRNPLLLIKHSVSEFLQQRRSPMMKALSTYLLLLLAVLYSTGCGESNSSSFSAASQGISGAYEFVAQSSVTGAKTLIEANLSAAGAGTSASGPQQVQTATYSLGTWYVNGFCSSPWPGQNGITGTVNGSNISLAFSEGGNMFNAMGTVSGTTVSGSYSGTNSNCSDSGTFTATKVPTLGGTFSGTLTFPSGSDQVTATLTESSGNVLTVQTALTGADMGNFSFSGSAVANVMFVSGTVKGNTISLFGYFDSHGTYTGTPNSIAVFDYTTLTYDGLLVKQ